MEPDKKSNGALTGLIIIVIILIVGGIYIWQSNKNLLDQGNQVAPDAITEEDTSVIDTLEQDLLDADTDIDVDLDAIN